MQSFNMTGNKGGDFVGKVKLEVSTPEHLNLAIAALKSFDYVSNVEIIP
jgi:hypothetical protein